MKGRLDVPGPMMRRIVHEAERASPAEVCGLAFGTETVVRRVVPLPNVHGDPRTGFAMDPVRVVRCLDAARARGESLVAIYHSHPGGGTALSAEDLAFALPDGVPAWPGVEHLVVGLTRGTARAAASWWLDGGRAEGQPIEVPAPGRAPPRGGSCRRARGAPRRRGRPPPAS